MRQLIFFIYIAFLSLGSFAQTNEESIELANQYYKNKEYDKSNIIYDKLINDKNVAKTIFNNYVNSLYETKDFKEASKIIKKMIQLFPATSVYEVELGNSYILSGNQKSGNQQFDNILKNIKNNKSNITEIANSFIKIKQYEYALRTLRIGERMFPNDNTFNLQIAAVYQEMGKIKEMLNEYIGLIEISNLYINDVQNYLQNALENDDNKIIKNALFDLLIAKIQSNPNEYVFSEMLIWLSIQEREFEPAFNQSKTLDRRLKENGNRLFNLASVCVANKDYATAEKCYHYIIDKGSDNPYYFNAKYELVNIQYLQITTKDKDITKAIELKKNYEDFFHEFGKNASTITLIKDYAHILAFYLDSIDLAINELDATINMGSVNQLKGAECKVELADIYLVAEELWDAVLLYSQVASDFKNDPIGHLAKFKKAKVFFYIGEFRWAQNELNVLKASTSKLISNDAMDLSIIITDNIGEDSSMTEISMYARADFLLFKNKTDLALETFDSIVKLYPWHSIVDETIFKQATIYESKKNYNKADSLYKYVCEMFPSDIYADDALYARALLNETEFNNKTLAMELYQEIITKYPGSLFVVEARKKFRTLRGDIIN
ncbi:MAG: hypothetical protein A2X12_08195 [Bacteroidetes bacterium GWE2_29_8]|nr:MAG: hypothetical protein A2X12_08195 [Bacteroidetes bacterium GWE2_29_8]OFY15652.1 MAG: hypothetical protein A2X02_06460 [Bacteroidetes bacterium GWF2_29_10]